MRIPMHLALPLLGFLAALHLTSIVGATANLPLMDEWNLLDNGGLETPFNWGWVFSPHNEHRIVFTKIVTWLLYRANGWHHLSNLVLNFFLYLLTVFSFILMLRAIDGTCEKTPRQGLSLAEMAWCILALSGIAWENHAWGFQSQFHFFLMFFFLGIVCALSRADEKKLWFAAPLAIFSACSFSSGVLCAFAIGGLLVARAAIGSLSWRRVAPHVLFIAVGVSLWFAGFQKHPGHPQYAWPIELNFWNHFLTMLGCGWAMHPGYRVPISAAILAVALFRIAQVGLFCGKRSQRNTNRDQLEWFAGLACGFGGLLATSAVTSIARAGLGTQQATAPRYTEFTFFLLPLIWYAFHSGPVTGLKAWVGKRQTIVLNMLFWTSVLWGFAPFFAYSKVYRWHAAQMAEGRKCVATFYERSRNGAAPCETLYPAPIQGYLNHALELNLAFTKEYRINQ